MRKPITRIAVPVDFTPASLNAVEVAIGLAGKFNAELLLLHIIDLRGSQLTMIPEMKARLISEAEYEKAIAKHLAALRDDMVKKHGITPIVEIGHGHVHAEIIERCIRFEVGMIVMGTHGASGWREMFIGSNAQRVITLSPFPVLSVQDGKGRNGFRSILVPIDDSVHSREKVNIAAGVAKAYDAEVTVIGLPDSTEEKEMKKFRVKLDSVEKLLKAEDVRFKTEIVNGDNVAQTALRYAGMNNCDLVVINTGHESKLTGLFLGGFAQQIVNHSQIPVLSVKHMHGEFEIETVGFGIS